MIITKECGRRAYHPRQSNEDELTVVGITSRGFLCRVEINSCRSSVTGAYLCSWCNQRKSVIVTSVKYFKFTRMQLTIAN